MRTRRYAILGVLAACALSAFGGSFTWNFNGATPSSSSDVTGLSAGAVSQGNNNGTTTLLSGSSASTNYPGASGSTNAAAAARTGALNTAASGSAYFEFTITPSGGVSATVTNLSFGARSTSTGPQAIAVFSSADSFAQPVAPALTVTNNGAWALQRVLANVPFSTATTFRIYGYGGTGAPGANTANWKLDDLVVDVSFGAGILPPPGGLAASAVTAEGFTASWSAVEGATGYLLTLNTIETTGTWPDIVEAFAPVPGWTNVAVAGTSQPVTGLTPKTTYYWFVKTVSGAGESVDSATAEITTLAAGSGVTLEAPAILSFARSAGSGATLTATSQTGVSYMLQWQTGGLSPLGWTDVGSTKAGTGTPLTFTDATERGAACFYRVRATAP